MGPKKLDKDFKTVKVVCDEGHEVARYRKPKAEWGHRTHKLWLVQERIGRLSTEPPILVEDEKTHAEILDIPDVDTPIYCGDKNCSLQVGTIAMIKGTVAIELTEQNLKPTKG